MPGRAFKLYQRKRVVNINVNVFVAGVVSITLAKYPVMVISGFIGHEHKLLISVLAYVIDTTIDILMYFGLHWVANHWRPSGSVEDAAEDAQPEKKRKFWVDVAMVQAERIALVPIFALMAISGTWALQHFGKIRPDWAFVWAFLCAMVVTRVLHTIWGYRTGTFRDRGGTP
ncbi:MAG: hypothetical protein KC996_01375 [Phycisphaerales bacterium]|nr:hypothetical protein [Phycisphaerales bacterium]